MGETVLNIINWFLGLASSVSVLMIIYGGVKYILARGNKEKETAAKKTFIYSLVIFIVLGFLYALLIPPSYPKYLK